MVTIDLDELRSWPTEQLRAARDEAVVEERRWRLRRVDLDRVLDERGATGSQDAAEWVQTRDKVRATTAHAEVEIGRALESLPEIRALAERGELSFDQLEPLVQLATPETDAEWARRGVHVAPSELSRMARRTRVVSAAEAEARQRAREFRWWRGADGGMLRVSGAIPDVNGAYVEAVFEHMVNAMKPPKGQPWDSRAHRGADALVELCRLYRNESSAPVAKRPWKPTVVVHVGSDAQPEVNGIPIAHETLQQVIAEGAKVRDASRPLRRTGRHSPTPTTGEPLLPRFARSGLRPRSRRHGVTGSSPTGPPPLSRDLRARRGAAVAAEPFGSQGRDPGPSDPTERAQRAREQGLAPAANHCGAACRRLPARGSTT